MNSLLPAFQHAISPTSLMLMMVGTSLGVVVGAVPGLTGAMLITLTVPLTFAMDSSDALTLLISMYVGSISGGLITATLLRMPGTPASIMTTLDGYPMARNGQPGRALGLGITASFVGGLISWVFLVVLARPMADLSLLMSPFEFFSLVMMALALIAAVSGSSLSRGLLSGMFGILATLPGSAPGTNQLRWTLGFPQLTGGLGLLPVLIGLFAVSQIIREIVRIDAPSERIAASSRGIWLSWGDLRRHLGNLLRSSLIGTWVGILPGVGANIGSVLAYSAARSLSKKPELFGTGAEEGIVASEAANNATVGGALIPLISFGIPGSVIDAILLGALVMHNLVPGPLLFRDNPQVVYIIMITMLLANVFMLGFMLAASRWIAKLADVPKGLLLPLLLVCCVVGAFAKDNRMFDVWVMLAFGGFGFLLESCKVPLAPFVIGFVLFPVAEENLIRGLQMSGGDYLPFLLRPVSLIFLVIAVVLLCGPLIKRLRQPVEDST